MYISAVESPPEELTTGGKLCCGSRASTCFTLVSTLVRALSGSVFRSICRVTVELP